MPPSERQLQDMGLTPTEENSNDESLVYSDWERKTALHEAIKASDQTDKPKEDILHCDLKSWDHTYL